MKYYLLLLLPFLLIIASIYTTTNNNVYSQQSNILCFPKDSNSVTYAPTLASYDIIIPFTNKNQTTFEPMEVNIPKDTQIRWINLDSKPHDIIISTNTNSTINTSKTLKYGNQLFEKEISLGELITYNFTNPCIYNYFDKNYPTMSGTINVGDAIEKGENMTMNIGTNLPINSTELKRIVFLIEPNSDKINIHFPDDLPLAYNFTLNNPYGYPQTYVNIHSIEYPNGEIRGQITTVNATNWWD